MASTKKTTTQKKTPAKKAAPKAAAPKKEKALELDAAGQRALLMAQAACDAKAIDLKVLDLRKLSAFADYFVIASGSSDRQVQAIGDRIADAVKKSGVQPIGIEGQQQGHWILIDCGSVIAHVFFEESRVFYGLDKLWGDATVMKLPLK